MAWMGLFYYLLIFDSPDERSDEYKETEMPQKDYTVRASYCNHRADDEEIYRTLKRTTEPLTRSWEKLEKARWVERRREPSVPFWGAGFPG